MSKGPPARLPARITLGVSACLLGEKVRYDGADRHQPWVTGTLAAHFDLVPVCPEVAIGLGVPRPPIRLEGDAARPRAVGVVERGLDVTARLERFGRRTVGELAGVSGFILKARSPSCGPAVKVHGPAARGPGRGLFAHELTRAMPLLPIVDEESLGEPRRREGFLERVFAWRRWQELAADGITAAALAEFHGAHALQLMAHSPVRCRALGQWVASTGARRGRAARYAQGFMATLAMTATPRRHARVLRHLAGLLRRELGADDREELRAAIEAVGQGRAAPAGPLALLRHHFRHHPHPGVERQWYLYPSPAEAMLRCR